MDRGGFNVVLKSGDSHEKHHMDTLKGGQYISRSDLALQLVEQATPTVARNWKYQRLLLL